MSNPTTSDWAYTAVLDACGFRCPLPVLKARKALLALKPGERLLVEATDPVATIDFPHFCAQSGHRLVATDSIGDRRRFLIEKG